jgi:hypothetical protein
MVMRSLISHHRQKLLVMRNNNKLKITHIFSLLQINQLQQSLSQILNMSFI